MVEAALRSPQDIGGEEADGEQTPVLLEEEGLGAETSFQENTTELLAYMGISTTAMSSWGDPILLDLCEPGDCMLPLKKFTGDCKTQTLYRGESAEPIDAYLNRYGRESWSTHDIRIDLEWDAYVSKIHGLAEVIGHRLLLYMRPASSPSRAQGKFPFSPHRTTWLSFQPLRLRTCLSTSKT